MMIFKKGKSGHKSSFQKFKKKKQKTKKIKQTSAGLCVCVGGGVEGASAGLLFLINGVKWNGHCYKQQSEPKCHGGHLQRVKLLRHLSPAPPQLWCIIFFSFYFIFLLILSRPTVVMFLLFFFSIPVHISDCVSTLSINHLIPNYFNKWNPFRVGLNWCVRKSSSELPCERIVNATGIAMGTTVL